MRAVKFGTLLLLVALSAAAATHAQVGVGVSLAKIVLDEPVVGGGSYDLPTVGVVNTGKEAGDYEVGVSYRSGQKQMKVPAEWISFTPKTFYLNAGEVRQVAVRLQVPMKAKPGDYFGFIDAHLAAVGTGVPISVAAATKLYFSVRPSNIFVAIGAKVSTFFNATAPVSYVLLGVVAVIVVVFIFKRFFRIRFAVERKQ